MDYEFVDVLLDQIDFTDNNYQITTNDDISELALSISAIGVLQPPLLVRKKSSYQVICGFRRLAACRSLKLSSLLCRLLSPGSPAIHYAQIAVSDNAFQRSLNVVEQSRASALIQRYSDGPDVTLEIAESIGLPSNLNALDRIRPIADMPESFQQAILEGSVAIPIALEINQWDAADADAVNDLFRKLTPGLNVQRELLTLLSEISLRDEIPIVQLIESKAVESIIANNDLSAPQRVNTLRIVLKKMRFPELSKRETVFHQFVKDLKLNFRMKLLPPRFFESKTYKVTLSFESREQLNSLQSELDKLIHHPDFLLSE